MFILCRKWNPTYQIHIILIFGVLFRIIGFYGEPIYEDDFYRYLWDGYRFAVSGTPYGPAPESYFNDVNVPENFQAVLNGINHPDIATIYSPSLQYLFVAAYWLSPGQLWAIKLILLIVDSLLLLLLARLASPASLLCYAWNPLVIKEIAYTGHPDGLIGGLLILSWFLMTRKQYAVSGISLAFAVAAKVSTWPLIPFFLLRLRFPGWLGFLTAVIALYLPFILKEGSSLPGLFAFAQSFEFNSSVYALMNLILPEAWSKLLLGLCYLLILGLYFNIFLKTDPADPPRVDWILGALLLVSPVFNPWYLLWLLPWACLCPSLAVWVSSGAVLLSYITGLNINDSMLGPYEHPIWVRPIEFTVIALALGWEILQRKQLCVTTK